LRQLLWLLRDTGIVGIVGIAARLVGNAAAKPFRGFRRTCQIGLTYFKGDILVLGVVRDKVVHTRGTPSATGYSNIGRAVQNALNAQVNVRSQQPLLVSHDLDAILEGGHGSVGPTTATVLRNVLVQHEYHETGAIRIEPTEIFGQLRGFQIFVGRGQSYTKCIERTRITDI
jgi:hypothetical protein